ncbi:cytochrome P450 [Mycena leptocephala]|nr:cytochrome P450 [Mycena leptocephala]
MSSAYYLYVGYVPGALILLALWLAARLFRYASHPSHTTKLNGPSRTSWIYGLSREISQAPDVNALYEGWAMRYGSVYEIPTPFGRKEIVLTDPKALLHFYQSDRAVYVKTENNRLFFERVFGRGILSAEGDVHKRHRKALTPGFSSAAIRELTDVFYDSAYKLKSCWDATLESDMGCAVIEVQEWMNRLGLDSIGIAGFSYDFRYLDGQRSPVTAAFEELQITEMSLLAQAVSIFSFTFPFLQNVPTHRMRLFRELRRSLNVIAERLLADTRREREGNVAEERTDKSVIGLLLRAEAPDAEPHLTREEVVAQIPLFNHMLIKVVSVSLTWALIELAKNPEIQDRLREELAQFGPVDPTWDQLVSELPYLDATVSEVLRLHPPVTETFREAAQDDVIPLRTPVVTPSGEMISSIVVAKGGGILVPIECINRCESLWGPDAKEFKPTRWFEDITFQAKELQGHRHLLTFHDGPRTCLGKSFALSVRHSLLLVLVRNFVFEFPDGPGTKIDTHATIVLRPKVAGHKGAKVPLRVRTVE